jgi:hypothetical protein
MVLKLNYRADHFATTARQALFSEEGCRSPIDFTTESIIIGACCLVGIIWAIYNLYLVRRIDVRKGYTGESYEGEDIPNEQKTLLLELGDKISQVTYKFIIGVIRVFKAGVSYLSHLRGDHVHHRYVLD